MSWANNSHEAVAGSNTVLSVNMWASIPPITYRLTDNEILTGSQPQAQQSRWLKPVWLAFAFIQVLNGSLHLYTHRSPIDVWIGAFLIVFGLLFAFQGRMLDFVRRRRLNGSREFRVRFDDVGITVDGSPAKTFPWRSIGSVQDIGGIFLFRCGTWRSITVPKRVLSDDGAALWALLEDHLIAKRGLDRRPGARTIINTALTA